MKILVINSGSSSIKYKLFSIETNRVLASGSLEKIGELGAGPQTTENTPISNHLEGMNTIVSLLTDSETGVIGDISEIDAVGHRVVHGGENFLEPTVVTDKVLDAIRETIPLAPLHNPANIVGIEVARKIFPSAIQVAVFDTAFHHSIPPKAYLYALPYELYTSLKIRRYGFHGTSHHYVAEETARLMEKPLSTMNLITIHLGNGCSVTAIEKGKSVDTSMGMTPLEGLIMGTRSGDIDPSIPHFLTTNANMSSAKINKLLNEQSGLKGICGLNDMRDIIGAVEKGSERACTALDMFTYRIKKFIGAYLAVLGEVDAIVFTAGIGEHAPQIRKRVCDGLEKLGIILDESKNASSVNKPREIQAAESPIRIFVIPTDEELKIAQETLRFVK
ncbi:MAG: acetate kinase [SAR324 cluster bacterium]|nr:acetate kinase [SAR324 cluster bacterium]